MLGSGRRGRTRLCLGLALLAGCRGGEEGGPRPEEIVTTFDTLESGVVEVVNRGYDARAAPAYRVTEWFRVGSMEGPDDALGAPRVARFGPRGRLWVLDHQTQTILVFGADGGLRATVGGPGRGPEEFRGAVNMATGPGDTVWVAQVANRRYTLVTPDGRIAGTRRRPYVNSIRGVFGFDDEGRLWDGYIKIVEPSVMDQVVVRRRPGRWTEPPDSSVLEAGVGRDREPSTDYRFHILGAYDRNAFHLSPRGTLWTFRGRPLTLVELSFEGRDRRRVTLPDLPLEEITEEEAAAYRDRTEEALGLVDAPPGRIVWVEEEWHPQLEHLTVDDRGRVWTFDLRTPGPDEEAVVRLFDPGGAYLGRVEVDFPFNAFTVSVQDDLFVARSEGPAGEPQVVVARVEAVGG